MWEPFGIAVAVELGKSFMSWLRRGFARGGIRVETRIEKGPFTHKLGFTEAALKITVVNESERAAKIIDIHLMFCGAYGASVHLTAPPERSHPELPAHLESGAEGNWYIPAEQLSELLYSLYHPPSTTKPTTREVKLHARCITGSGKLFKSPVLSFSTDSKSFGF